MDIKLANRKLNFFFLQNIALYKMVFENFSADVACQEYIGLHTLVEQIFHSVWRLTKLFRVPFYFVYLEKKSIINGDRASWK